MSESTKDVLLRTIRSFLQAFVGTLLTTWAAVYVTPGVLPEEGVLKRLAIAAVVAGVVAALTALQNALENASGKSLLGTKPEVKQLGKEE